MEKTAAKRKNTMTAAEKAGAVARTVLLLVALVLMVIGASMMDLALGWALLGSVLIFGGMGCCWASFKKV